MEQFKGICLREIEFKNARASFEVNQVIRIKYLLLSRFHAFIVRASCCHKDWAHLSASSHNIPPHISAHNVDVLRILWFPLEIITGGRKK